MERDSFVSGDAFGDAFTRDLDVVDSELRREENESRDSLGVNDEIERPMDVIAPEVRCGNDFGDDQPAGDIPLNAPILEIDEQGCLEDI